MAVNPMSFQVGNVSFVVQPNQQPVEGTTPRDDLYRLNLSGDQKTAMEPLFAKVEELLTQNGERLQLANVYKEIGKELVKFKLRQDAINYDQKALDLYLQEQGEQHEEVADCYYRMCSNLTNIAEVLYDLAFNQNVKVGENISAKYKECIDLCQKALDIRLQLYGDNHTKIADCYYWLGWCFCVIGTIEFKTNSHGSQMHKLATEKVQTAIDYGKKGIEIYRGCYEEKPGDVAHMYRLLQKCSRALSLDGGQTVHLGMIQKYGDLAGSIEQAIEWKKPLPTLPGGPKKASDQKCSIS